LILQISDVTEAKKLKKILKKLKELKKLKKYAWILAAQNKKFYAIPFPMPLPVFVKRQQIYTQIPIIPRYVQHPQPYGTPAMPHQSIDSIYSQSDVLAAGGTTTGETRYPSGLEYYQSQMGSSSKPKRKRSKQQSAASGYSSSSATADQYGAALANSAKYLQQIAAILTRNYDGLSGGYGSSSGKGRDVLNKLLTGQAKVLAPTSLLASIKSSPAAMPSAAYGAPSGLTSQEQKAHNDLYDQPQNEQGSYQEGKTSQQSSDDESTGGDSGGSSSYHSGGSSSKSKHQSDGDSTSSDTKTSASEFYGTIPKPLKLRMNQLAQMQQQQQLSLIPINRLIGMGLLPPLIAPGAGLPAPLSPEGFWQKTNPALQMSLQQQQQQQHQQSLQEQGDNHLDDQHQSEQQDMAASQEQEQLSTAEGQQAAELRSRQLLLRQIMLARQMQQQQLPQKLNKFNPIMEQQLMLLKHKQLQQQELLKLALAAREQRDAQQLDESRAIIVRARQLGLIDPKAQRLVQALRLRQQELTG